jgi:negative modulator of initiation of replication
MRTIQLDQETYEFLRRNNQIGEQVLRRLLHLPPYEGVQMTADNNGEDEGNSEEDEFRRFLDSPELDTFNDMTSRYLRILSFAHGHKPAAFPQILSLRGRKRRYFGRTEEDIERSGISTQPRQIPGTNYWALTNCDDRDKKHHLKNALRLMGYSQELADHATSQLARQ